MPRPGSGGSPRNLMRQLQEMQDKMAAEQAALGDETVEVTVGGGAVKVVMNGHQKLRSVTIDAALLSSDEQEMLQDLIIAAVNEAVDRSQALAAERMGSVTQGLQLPPGLGF
jgi:nucleoid-associated protein EbfC